MALQTYTWETGDYAYQSWSNGYKIHLTLTEESTNSQDNTSAVSYKFWISNGSNNRFQQGSYSWTISIGGQSIAIKNFSFNVYPYNVTQNIATGRVAVKHNDNGTLNMPFSVFIPNVKADNRHAPPDMYITGNWALTAINSTPPAITASVVDINPVTTALTGNSNWLIRHYSTAHATMSATAQPGATIDQDMYTITNGTTTVYGTSHTFENVVSNTFRFSAQDNYGNVGTKTLSPYIISYINPTCNIETARPDASGKMDLQCFGTFFDGSFGAVENTLGVKCRYRVQGGTYGSWITMSIVENAYVDDICYYGAYASFQIADFDYKTTYEFECQVTDKLCTVTSTPGTATSTPVFHWGKNDFAFEVPVAVKGDVDIKGDLRLKGDGNYGNTLRFGDGDYCYIAENSDDAMDVKANFINLDAISVYLYGYPMIDFIVEKGTEAMGTNGTWYWTKWYSGRAECYGTRNFGKAAITTAWGSLYESTAYTQDYPIGLFVAKPDTLQITVDYCGGHGVMLERGGAEPTSTNTGGFCLVRPTSVTVSQSDVTFHAIGRWK